MALRRWQEKKGGKMFCIYSNPENITILFNLAIHESVA